MTASAMTKQAACIRFPCDHAHTRQTHVPDEDGRIVHSVSCAGSAGEGWHVAVVAFDHGPWRVAVACGDDGDALTLIGPAAVLDLGVYRDWPPAMTADALDNAAQFAQGLMTAVSMAAKASLLGQ